MAKPVGTGASSSFGVAMPPASVGVSSVSFMKRGPPKVPRVEDALEQDAG